MKLYIIRHGETDYNLKHMHDHENKAQLTEYGKMRADKIWDLFSETQIDAIISSPFSRCIDTIIPLARNKNIPIQENILLREFYLGPMQDKSWYEVDTNYNRLLHDINAEKQENCEHMKEVTIRVTAFLSEILRTYNHEDTLVISTHSGVILYLLSIIDEIPAKNGLEFLPNNSGISHTDAYIFREI